MRNVPRTYMLVAAKPIAWHELSKLSTFSGFTPLTLVWFQGVRVNVSVATEDSGAFWPVGFWEFKYLASPAELESMFDRLVKEGKLVGYAKIF